jgi:broad specificity phosphatase PhoE
MNLLYFVRHGENRANLTREFSYKLIDYPLTEKGVLQARQTGCLFEKLDIDAVYSSPLLRAVQTAELIAAPHGLPVQILEQFREVNVGRLEEGPPDAEKWRQHNQVIAAWWQGNPSARFPGGENLIELLKRMRLGLETVLDEKEGRRLVIVAHGGLFTFTIASFCPDTDLDWVHEVPNHNCSISQVSMERRDGLMVGRVLVWASYDHLSGEAAELVSGIPDQEAIESGQISNSASLSV